MELMEKRKKKRRLHHRKRKTPVHQHNLRRLRNQKLQIHPRRTPTLRHGLILQHTWHSVACRPFRENGASAVRQRTVLRIGIPLLMDQHRRFR
jgi:hypothetical protein